MFRKMTLRNFGRQSGERVGSLESDQIRVLYEVALKTVTFQGAPGLTSTSSAQRPGFPGGVQKNCSGQHEPCCYCGPYAT